jgi:hypothetical protein
MAQVSCTPGVQFFYRVEPHRKVVWFNFIRSHCWKQKNYIVSTSAPNAIPGSNSGAGRRFECTGLA